MTVSTDTPFTALECAVIAEQHILNAWKAIKSNDQLEELFSLGMAAKAIQATIRVLQLREVSP